MAKFQSAIVFGLDDKLITSIKSTSGMITGFGLSIALNFTCKQKQDEKNRLSSNAIFLLEIFERSITILV